MEDGESINIVKNQFKDIVAALQKLGKELSLDEINQKSFASLPIEWRPKLTVIETTKNLKTITTKELLGSLITHEHIPWRKTEEKEVDKKKDKRSCSTIIIVR